MWIDPKRRKLASRAYECVFIGYAVNSKAYRFYDLKDKVIIESNDADFYEYKFPFKLKNSGGSTSSNEPIIRINESNKELDIEPRRSKRPRIAKDFGSDFYAYTLEEDRSLINQHEIIGIYVQKFVDR